MNDPKPINPKPINDCLIAKTLTQNDINKSVLARPDQKTNDSAGLGEVVFLPDDYEGQIEVGDVVAFMPFQDVILNLQDVKYSIIELDKVRAVLKNEEV